MSAYSTCRDSAKSLGVSPAAALRHTYPHKMDTKSIQISVIDVGAKKLHSDAVTLDEALELASKVTVQLASFPKY